MRRYPLPRPAEGADDDRFTLGLALDVGEVLERHGFPALTESADVLELQLALFRFLYEAKP